MHTPPHTHHMRAHSIAQATAAIFPVSHRTPHPCQSGWSQRTATSLPPLPPRPPPRQPQQPPAYVEVPEGRDPRAIFVENLCYDFSKSVVKCCFEFYGVTGIQGLTNSLLENVVFAWKIHPHLNVYLLYLDSTWDEHTMHIQNKNNSTMYFNLNQDGYNLYLSCIDTCVACFCLLIYC